MRDAAQFLMIYAKIFHIQVPEVDDMTQKTLSVKRNQIHKLLL